MEIFKKIKPKVKQKEIKESLSSIMIKNKKEKKRVKYNYYYNLIVDNLMSASIQEKDFIYLENIEHCHYYSIDDTVFYYDTEIKNRLLNSDIASYTDSSNNVIVTFDPYRVEQQKEQSKFNK